VAATGQRSKVDLQIGCRCEALTCHCALELPISLEGGMFPAQYPMDWV
jgi:hypothetical protein